METVDRIVWRHPHLPESFERVALLVDKPTGPTSFAVVRTLRRLTGIKKVGHAGTLDPMASGLLVLLFGSATKHARHFQQLDKEYQTTMRLGEATASYDSETPVLRKVDPSHLTTEQIRGAMQALCGTITQLTPPYSAVKLEGERMYRKVRRGERVKPVPRVVDVASFELTERRGSDVDAVIQCSTGTYVRSLADAVGSSLGVGGHLVRLRRTRIGDYRADEAWPLAALVEALGEAYDG